MSTKKVPNPLDNHHILHRFQALSEFLTFCQPLWQERSFFRLPLAWEAEYPKVAQWLRQLARHDWEDYDIALNFPDLPEQLKKWWQQSQELVTIGSFPRGDFPAEGEGRRLATNIPLRKWQQIQPFAATCNHFWQPGISEIVDWCAGKGHLGRTLARLHNIPVNCIEYQEKLCQYGQKLLDSFGQPGCFTCADVLKETSPTYFSHSAAVVALHACGNLHQKLITQALEQRIHTLFLAPCCYHRIGEASYYPPLSQQGQATQLCFDQNALRLATSEEVIATAKQRKLRRRTMAWRLGVDLLIREATGEDFYHTFPSFPKKWLKGSFESFSRTVAREFSLPIPASFCPDKIEQAAWQRLRTVRALGVVLNIFRRPLELWFVLDRALFLVENNIATQVGTFCPHQVTPRNLMIVARPS